MSEDEFWHLTLKEFNALIRRYQDNKEWLDYRSAMICALLANMFKGKNTKPFVPRDFMPQTRTAQQTPGQILAAITLINAAHGGNIKDS